MVPGPATAYFYEVHLSAATLEVALVDSLLTTERSAQKGSSCGRILTSLLGISKLDNSSGAFRFVYPRVGHSTSGVPGTYRPSIGETTISGLNGRALGRARTEPDSKGSRLVRSPGAIARFQ